MGVSLKWKRLEEGRGRQVLKTDGTANLCTRHNYRGARRIECAGNEMEGP